MNTTGSYHRRKADPQNRPGCKNQRNLSQGYHCKVAICKKRGREEYFPYQEEADVMFNSALIYELACLKVYAEPLLFGISKEEPEYLEANRLLKFFDYFVAVPSEEVPNNSLLREFIGGSCFNT